MNLFCYGFDYEVQQYFDFVLLYSTTIGMEINENKFILYTDGLDAPQTLGFGRICPF